MNYVNLIIALIVIVGAINWGMVAGLNKDLVKMATMGNGDIERYVKIAVGLAGLYYAYLIVSAKMQEAKDAKSA
jgi:uncharacterized membrane protein YuzA (DUF378 family)